MTTATWLHRTGQSSGGFTVGHRARMVRSTAEGEIIGLHGDGADLKVLMYFHDAQPVDVPEGSTSHRFELNFRNIESTWAQLRTVSPHRRPAATLPLHDFGLAPMVVPAGYELREEFAGTEKRLQDLYAGQYVVFVKSAPSADIDKAHVGVFGWTPEFAPWRHGGWYVENVRYPTGASGCVSCKYLDKKWRIVCDPRRIELGEPGDFTFPTRDAAARAELELVNSLQVMAHA